MLLKKRMIQLIGLIFLFLLLVSWKSYEDKNMNSFSNYMRTWSDIYRNESIESAKNATLHFIEIIKEYKNADVKGIDYGDLLCFMYVRLYIIEMQKGSYKTAQKFLEKSANNIDDGRNLSASEIEREKKSIIVFVKELDCNHSVNWLICSNSGGK